MLIDLQHTPVALRQSYLLHAVAPRPIALVSTIDKKNNVNLSPFSFFNVFSSNPPLLIFSAARRIRDNTTKHSFDNLYDVREVVVSIVDYPMVHQINLASHEYPKGTNEFVKAGFTEEPATMVKPPMVKESKVKMECKVIEIKPTGKEGGAGNLVICEILCMHIDESILDENQMIDQKKLHHVARLGGDWYSKIDAGNLFKVQKPGLKQGIGVDGLPETIKNNKDFTLNHLAQLAGVFEIPQPQNGFAGGSVTDLLDEGKTDEAWQCLLKSENPL